MEYFQESRLKDGKSPATINSEIALLKSALSFAVSRDLISTVPTISPLPVEERIEDLPTIAEMKAVIDCIDPQHRVLLLLMAETGCRRSEAQTLPWRHVNEVKGTVKFQRYVNESGEVWTTKRSSSNREVPISDELLQEIRSLEKVSEYVFPGKDKSKPLNNFRRALKTAILKSGIKHNDEPIHITPQVIRQAVLTWHIEKGTPESVVQALCGHAKGSRITQKAYLRHGQKALREALIPMAQTDQSKNNEPQKLATKTKITDK